MMDSNSVYPYFERMINDIIVEINRNIEFKRDQDPNVFLHKISNHLEVLKQEMVKKPAISNVNFEKLINSACLEAKLEGIDIDGVSLMVVLKDNPDFGKFYSLNINIPRK